ncbi:MAG: O-antigen ligase family protein [Lentisphaerae bacterium]|nr:O-antigen ligase family protein [Lentisphaerota bacterium]
MAVKKFLRCLPALMLLIAPFFAMPLAFLRLTGKAVPLYGLVKLADFPVLVLLALAVILFFPQRLREFFRQKDLYYLFGAAGLFLLNSAISLFTKNSTLEEFCTPLFWILYPIAVMTLAPEIRKILPCFAGVTALILIYSGTVSENFTGLAGNWNWLQGFITALLPAIALWGANEITVAPGCVLTAPARCRRNRAIILLALFFTGVGIFFPEGLSRGALAAAAGAGLFLYFQRKMPREKFFKLCCAALGVLLAGFIVLLLAGTFSDTRFLIWQGALDAALDAPFSGQGCGKFSEVIRAFLSESYFLSPFPAPHIDHAHNDFIHLFVENGFAGVIFYLTALFTLLRRRDNAFIRWIFLVLIICGWFDQHNFTVLGAGLLAVAAGLLISPHKKAEVAENKLLIPLRIAGAVTIFAAIHFAIVDYQTTGFIRQGDLHLIRGDIKTAFSRYLDSVRQKRTTHALYQLAELSLVRGIPDTAQKFLLQLEDELGKTGYRHTRRLRAVAALQLGDMTGAAQNMAHEMDNAPFSVINARFNRIIIRNIHVPGEMIAQADNEFLKLCKMRNITPEEAETFSVQKDDSPFPQKSTASDAPLTDKAILFNMIKTVSAAIILMLAVYGSGTLLLNACGVSPLPAPGAGVIIFAAAVLLLPLAAVKYAMFIFALAGAYIFWKNERREWKTILICAIIFTLMLPALLLPPAAWDEQVYQISLLKKYLALDSVMPQTDNPYSAYPSLGQLWLLPGFAAGGMNVPLVISGMLTVITGAVLFRFARKISGTAGAVTAAVMIFASPLTWVLTRSLYMEIFITLFTLAGAWLILKESATPKRHIFIAGAMAGAACAVKLTGSGAALALLILLMFRRETRKYLLFFLAGAAVAALPFFLRVWTACGNPFYPYFSTIFSTSESAAMVENFHRALGGNYGINPVLGTVFNVILCAYDGINYDGLVCGFQYTLAVIILIAGVIVCRRSNSRFTAIFTALAGAWIFWNFTAQQSRFLYPLLWGCALCTVYALTLLPVRWKNLLCAALMLAALPMAVLNFPSLKHYFLAWKNAVESQKNPVHFTSWQNNEPAYAEVAFQLKALEKYSVASLWERRTLYFPGNVTIIMPRFQEKLTPVPANSAELFAVLKEFDFIIVRPPQKDVDKGIEFVPEAVKINDMLMALLQNGRLQIHSTTSDGQISILRIVPETAPISTR